MKRDALVVHTEMDVLRAVAWWAEHDEAGGRRDAFAAFLADREGGVRLAELPDEAFEEAGALAAVKDCPAAQECLCAEKSRRAAGGPRPPAHRRRYTDVGFVPTTCELTLEGHSAEVWALAVVGSSHVVSGGLVAALIWSRVMNLVRAGVRGGGGQQQQRRDGQALRVFRRLYTPRSPSGPFPVRSIERVCALLRRLLFESYCRFSTTFLPHIGHWGWGVYAPQRKNKHSL